MEIGFSQQFNTSGIHQSLKRIQGFRRIELELLDGSPRDGEGNLEAAFALFYQFIQQLIGWQIAFFCHFFHHQAIQFVVKHLCISIDVQNVEVIQPVGLVNLKVEDDI